MTTKTRYFVIASLLVLGVGLGTGLVAYYVGFPAHADGHRGGPAELEFVPRDVAVIAFADVHDIMTSDLRQKMRQHLPMKENGQQELENQTGINIERDIDRVVAAGRPENGNGAGIVLARGRFDEVRIESLMREHGAHVEDYSGKRIIIADAGDASPATAPDAVAPRRMHGNFAVAFVEPGLAALGSTTMIKSAIDLFQQHAGKKSQPALESAADNDELMNMVRSIDGGNAWAVGRFDALRANARLPQNVMDRIPPISWLAITSHVDGGLRGTLRADARDDESANNLRDVVRGFLALAKMGAGSRPELQAMMSSLELGGTGKTVSLDFNVPGEVFDLIGAAAAQHAR